MENNYSCEKCNFSTAKKSNLTVHLKSVKHLKNIGLVEKEYKCEACQFETKLSANWFRHLSCSLHLKRVKNPKKVFKCDQCEKNNTFDVESEYKKHLKLEHSCTLHYYECGLCNMTFTNERNMLFHHTRNIEHRDKAIIYAKGKGTFNKMCPQETRNVLHVLSLIMLPRYLPLKKLDIPKVANIETDDTPKRKYEKQDINDEQVIKCVNINVDEATDEAKELRKALKMVMFELDDMSVDYKNEFDDNVDRLNDVEVLGDSLKALERLRNKVLNENKEDELSGYELPEKKEFKEEYPTDLHFEDIEEARAVLQMLAIYVKLLKGDLLQVMGFDNVKAANIKQMNKAAPKVIKYVASKL